MPESPARGQFATIFLANKLQGARLPPARLAVSPALIRPSFCWTVPLVRVNRRPRVQCAWRRRQCEYGKLMSMTTSTIVTLEEYLGGSYEPDCEYLDGELVEHGSGKA